MKEPDTCKPPSKQTKKIGSYPLTYFGFCITKPEGLPFKYNVDDYLLTDDDKIKSHRDFLKSFESEENARLSIIEGKTAQLASQTGLIFSVLGLFMPVFSEKVMAQPGGVRLVFLIVLVLCLLFYFLTIYNAIKNFNVRNFKYMKPSPENVIKYQDKSPNEFTAVEVKDLLEGINNNLAKNDDKASNLLYAFRAYRLAIALTAVLVFYSCYVLLFPKSKDNTVVITGQVRVQGLDSAAGKLAAGFRKLADVNVGRNMIADSIPKQKSDTDNHAHRTDH